jgi:hypothetical protein
MAERPSGHEPSAVAVPRILGVGAVLAIGVVVVVITIRIVIEHWIAPQYPELVARPAAIPPGPRLQPHPDNDLAVLLAQKDAVLSTWAWSDSAHDFAQVPIERAMALYAKQPVAGRSPEASTAQPQAPRP